MSGVVRIGNRPIGRDHPCFIIAEAGVNHNGDLELAARMIDSAAAAGADAIKFQSFVSEELITLSAPRAAYQVKATGDDSAQYAMLKALELSDDGQLELKRKCDEVGIHYLCTPYERHSVDLLDRLDVAAYKIASTDVTNLPFLRYLGSKGRPVILSSGMSTLGEIEAALGALRASSEGLDIVLLHCTAEYPAPLEDVNLRAIGTLERAFGCPTGFSDHTGGIGASPWAVAVGACVVEKHFTLDRKMQGPDHPASIEPEELRDLVRTIREVERALGDGVKRLMPSELENKKLMQKSLVFRRDIRTGGRIGEDDVVAKRPGGGLPPEWLDRVVGCRVALDVRVDEMLTLGAIDWQDYTR
jgi:N,N'-diacetyllegionaminate synthase